MRRTVYLLAILCLAPGVSAQVLESSPGHFVLEQSVRLEAPPNAVWAVFVEIDGWWHPDHTFGGDAARLSLVTAPGGCFCEQLPDGGFVEHMRVVYAEPGVTLRMVGGLGPLQEFAVSGAMTWSFAPRADGTLLTLRYRVGGIADGGLDAWAEPVSGVLAEQLSRLQALVAGRPATP